jgi:prepilin-type N-terminal cleavage/methylation domain-containing protein
MKGQALRFNRLRLGGFTLLELSVVTVLVGTLAAGGLVMVVGYTQASLYNNTVARMDIIESTLLSFAAGQNRIPCPSNLTCKQGQLNYGTEGNCASTTASCTSGTTGVNYLASSVAEGGVPVRALRLSDAYQFDAWGHRIRYAAYTPATKPGSVPVSSSGCSAGITVKDINNNARTIAAVYVLLSHGQNGHGAFTANGSIVNAGSNNGDELKNCHCNNAGTPGTYLATYVQEALNLNNSSGATYSYDDIVAFKENWQMQSPTNPLKPATGSGFTAPADGSYMPGQVLSFVMTFPSTATVTGSPQLDLTPLTGGYIGPSGTIAYATYAGGSGTNTLTFNYTVAATDYAPNGIAVASTIDLNGGTVSASCQTFLAPTLAGILITPFYTWPWFF